MEHEGRVRAWLTLASVKGLGSQALHSLLSTFGSPEATVSASQGVLRKVVSPEIATAIKLGDATFVETALGWVVADATNHLLFWDDPEYPKALLDVGEVPVVLYFRGRRELLQRPSLAIVGSRNATPSGLQTAEEFAQALAAAGLTIVSGLALGIDAAAHRGALRAGSTGGSTLAVVGTGIDRIYPARNEALARRIAEEGGVLSEFPLGTPALKMNFPQRNRLISGLARGVLVVEAALGSGSLITARSAGEQGREVFAIPGSIHSPLSKGCHKLIREGAKLVETAGDVLGELRVATSVEATDSKSRAEPGERGTLLRALGFDPLTPDELVGRLSWPVERVMTHLLELEMSGRIARINTGRFQRIG